MNTLSCTHNLHSPFPLLSVALPWEEETPAADAELLLSSETGGGGAMGWKAVLSVEGMRETRLVGRFSTPLLVMDRRPSSPLAEEAEEGGA